MSRLAARIPASESRSGQLPGQRFLCFWGASALSLGPQLSLRQLP
jgi:hypothetical protein